MEIREFAETILLGPSLGEKLTAPGKFTDGHPGLPIEAPSAPGRLPALQFRQPEGRKRQGFPARDRLVHDSERGLVLHFFANHELLAMELMALCLLRFPTAPAEFRRGLVRTIQEEQSHMQLYINRMQELGVGFGDAPLNDFFWHCLADMDHPRNFLAGLSLTLEQANLDFAVWYESLFREVGDEASATIMNTILADEIGHVALGLRWYKDWTRDRPGSLWQNYIRDVPSPPGPSRGKGPVYYREARLKAGFDRDYLDQMEIHPVNRGRPPDLYWYNPDAEKELAVGPGYRAIDAHRLLMDDFAVLPAFLALEGDVVLCPRPPGTPWLLHLRRLGFSLPEFRTCQRGRGSAPVEVERKGKEAAAAGGRFRPWAHTPCTDRLRTGQSSGDYGWLSKAKLPDLRRHLGEKFPELEELAGPAGLLGSVCRSVHEVMERAQTYHDRTGCPVVVRHPYSAAGQGMIRFNPGEKPPDENRRGWLENTLGSVGEVLVDPWLDRQLDFSVLLEIRGADDFSVKGITRFFADERGQYRGHLVGSALKGLPFGADAALMQERGEDQPLALWQGLKKSGQLVAAMLAAGGYRGPAGIDMFIYRAFDGEQPVWYLRPLCEVNARFTMGHVALALHKKVDHNVPCLWLPLGPAHLLASPWETWADFGAGMKGRFGSGVRPAADLLQPVGGMQEGVFFTNDPDHAVATLGVVAVGKPACVYLRDLAGLPEQDLVW